MTDPGEKTILTVPQSSTIQDLAKEYAKQKGMHIDDVGLVCGDCVYAGFNVALGATEPDASARGALLQSPWEANNDQINLAEELKQRNEAALRPLVARNRDGGGFVDLTMAESEIGAMRMLLNSARVQAYLRQQKNAGQVEMLRRQLFTKNTEMTQLQMQMMDQSQPMDPAAMKREGQLEQEVDALVTEITELGGSIDEGEMLMAGMGDQPPLPPGPPPAPPAPPPPAVPLPAGWIESVDSGIPCWMNTDGRKTYTTPSDLAPAPPASSRVAQLQAEFKAKNTEMTQLQMQMMDQSQPMDPAAMKREGQLEQEVDALVTEISALGGSVDYDMSVEADQALDHDLQRVSAAMAKVPPPASPLQAKATHPALPAPVQEGGYTIQKVPTVRVVQELVDMGFPKADAEEAVKQAKGKIDVALNILTS